MAASSRISRVSAAMTVVLWKVKRSSGWISCEPGCCIKGEAPFNGRSSVRDCSSAGQPPMSRNVAGVGKLLAISCSRCRASLCERRCSMVIITRAVRSLRP
jgi:hypothetical protein